MQKQGNCEGKVEWNNKNGFSWFVGTTKTAILHLTGIPIKDYFMNPNACIEAYRKGRPLVRELFGEEVTLPAVSSPLIKYGHLNTLGVEVNFPEEGEPHPSPPDRNGHSPSRVDE